MHSTGEKTVPGPMEEIIGSSPMYAIVFFYCNFKLEPNRLSVANVVVFGREHDQAGVLIEPLASYAINPSDTSELASLRNKVW